MSLFNILQSYSFELFQHFELRVFHFNIKRGTINFASTDLVLVLFSASLALWKTI